MHSVSTEHAWRERNLTVPIGPSRRKQAMEPCGQQNTDDTVNETQISWAGGEPGSTKTVLALQGRREGDRTHSSQPMLDDVPQAMSSVSCRLDSELLHRVVRGVKRSIHFSRESSRDDR